jgi:hypothetical protein
MGGMVFVVVVVGGMGSLTGAFLASLLIGLLQTVAVRLDVAVGSIKVSQMGRCAAVPGLMVLMLIWRAEGLLGVEGSFACLRPDIGSVATLQARKHRAGLRSGGCMGCLRSAGAVRAAAVCQQPEPDTAQRRWASPSLPA